MALDLFCGKSGRALCKYSSDEQQACKQFHKFTVRFMHDEIVEGFVASSSQRS